MKNNIKYSSIELAEFYDKSRTTWQDFYDSEKTILEKFIHPNNSILDLGCACGGLGKVLSDKFLATDYWGIDINPHCVGLAKKRHANSIIECGDILDHKFDKYTNKFDRVISFSCSDWNVQSKEMFQRAWSFVTPGGVFIASLRLTKGKTIVDSEISYQTVFGEHAAYCVYNLGDALRLFDNPKTICAVGDVKEIRNNTTCPYDQLCFSVFAVTKRQSSDISETVLDLDLPL
jgi:SAM-dependent methyltransferase